MTTRAVHAGTLAAVVTAIAAVLAVLPAVGSVAIRGADAKAGAESSVSGSTEKSSVGKAEHLRVRAVPGWGSPSWGGRSFDDSIANINPWTKKRDFPVVQDLDPVAPFDSVNKDLNWWVTAVTGAAPKAPTDEAGTLDYSPALRSDYLPPGSYPEMFPADSQEPPEKSSPIIPIGKRNLIASADKLRPPYAWRSSGNYPLVAPADRIISSKKKIHGWLGARELQPWPVSSTEIVDDKFAKYFEQVHNREQRRKARVEQAKAYDAADKDRDGTVSREEYDQLVLDKQNKTREEAERLWGRYHASEETSISRADFQRLLDDGFDLGAIDRNDISSVLRLPGAPHTGFWGSGAKCPHNSYVVGAKLKIMPNVLEGDDTALNALGLRCSDGTEAFTVEGPSGTWTEWALCPEGQRVFSARARSFPFKKGQDNAALATLELGCRRPDLGAMARLQFAAAAPPKPENNVVMAMGPEAQGGGWTKDNMCEPNSAVCGAQAHVIRDQHSGDDMGLADLRIYCCVAPVDCSEACGAAEDPKSGSVRCQVCHIAAGMKKAHFELARSKGIKGRPPRQEDFKAGRRRRTVVLPPLPSKMVPLPSEIFYGAFSR